jgi:hypothetical protein
MSVNLCTYRSQHLSYATTTDERSLLNELGIVFVHNYFNDWYSDISAIYDYISTTQGLIVKNPDLYKSELLFILYQY